MTKRTFALLFGGIVIILIAGFAYYTFSRDTFTQTETQEFSEDDIEKIIADVGKHIQLPAGESPQIATIVDAASLIQAQPFYNGAEDGDILFIYAQASKAIIYSPRRDIIVNVGPIIVDEENTATVDVADGGGA